MKSNPSQSHKKIVDKVKEARAYDQAAMKYHGEFAWLNFPLKGESI